MSELGVGVGMLAAFGSRVPKVDVERVRGQQPRPARTLRSEVMTPRRATLMTPVLLMASRLDAVSPMHRRASGDYQLKRWFPLVPPFYCFGLDQGQVTPSCPR